MNTKKGKKHIASWAILGNSGKRIGTHYCYDEKEALQSRYKKYFRWTSYGLAGLLRSEKLLLKIKDTQ